MEFVALVLSFDSIHNPTYLLGNITHKKYITFSKKINGASCPVARARGAPLLLFLVKLITTTTLVVYILLHSRTISYSEPQLGHMKSGRPDAQSTWAHFRQFCH